MSGAKGLAYMEGGVLLSKNKIMDIVLLAASVLIAVVQTIIEREKSHEDNE